MPWKETSVVDQRFQLIAHWLSTDYTKSELSRMYEVSRPTVDKWLKRYEQRGAQALEDLCRAPRTHPNETPEKLRAMIVQTKLAHQTWGPKKVLDRLRREQPKQPWPADSTAGEILKRAGLVRSRVKRRHVPPYSEPFSDCTAPNHSWSADFKGDLQCVTGGAVIR